jgi:hypothetical protein
MAPLLPYYGTRVREHFGSSAHGHDIDEYGRDVSRTKLYKFNALGFRGPDFDDNAQRRLYVAGCSYTLGTGLDWEETWAYQFAGMAAQRWGISRSELCLMNFSQGGASNAYIARTLIEQATQCAPDLMVAHFTFAERTEYLIPLESRPPSAHGPGLAVAEVNRATGTGATREELRGLPPELKRLHKTIRAWGKHYYAKVYEKLSSLHTTLEKMVTLQSFCTARGIEHLICAPDPELRTFDDCPRHPALLGLARAIDWSRVVPFSVNRDRIDVAADGGHPGPESNRQFATRLWDVYSKLPSGSPSAWPSGSPSAWPSGSASAPAS